MRLHVSMYDPLLGQNEQDRENLGGVPATHLWCQLASLRAQLEEIAIGADFKDKVQVDFVLAGRQQLDDVGVASKRIQNVLFSKDVVFHVDLGYFFFIDFLDGYFAAVGALGSETHATVGTFTQFSANFVVLDLSFSRARGSARP